MPAVVSEAELDRERAHLDRAREELARMRERTASLTAHAGDRISAEALEATLARRLAQLADDPHVPLFFGRLDHDEPSGGEVFHVGRRHVSDTAGDPLELANTKAGVWTGGVVALDGAAQQFRYGALPIAAHNQTLIARALGEIAGLRTVLEQVAAGTALDLDAVQQAARDGVTEALAALAETATGSGQ